MTLYYVCTVCGFTDISDTAPSSCLSCGIGGEYVGGYRTLAEADADVGHLFKRPTVEARGPSASDLVARARPTNV